MTWVVEAVDVFKEGNVDLPAGLPVSAPYHFRLQGFEEALDRGVIITVALAAHGWCQTLFSQDILIVMGTVLAASIRVMKEALRWATQGPFRGCKHPLPGNGCPLYSMGDEIPFEFSVDGGPIEKFPFAKKFNADALKSDLYGSSVWEDGINPQVMSGPELTVFAGEAAISADQRLQRIMHQVGYAASSDPALGAMSSRQNRLIERS